MEKNNRDWMSYIKQLEDVLSDYLVKKAPAVPKNIKDILVAIIPWLTVACLIYSVLLILGLSTFSVLLIPISIFVRISGGDYTLLLIFTIFGFILKSMAVKGLFHQTINGWQFLFYSVLVHGVYRIITGDLGGVILSVISLYFLFQVKESYK